jgi:hypothetical protein
MSDMATAAAGFRLQGPSGAVAPLSSSLELPSTSSDEVLVVIAEKLRELHAEVRGLREAVAGAAAELPNEITVAQAMRITNHRSTSAFFRWAALRRVRPVARGRYSKRRIQAALAA